MKTQAMLKIPISNILMVENYAPEWEQDPVKDVLILSALRQMLRAADDYLEDLPPGITGNLHAPLIKSWFFLKNPNLYIR